jgi:DNA repair protein RAD7
MPNLKTLQLSFCGRLVDLTLTAIISRLKSLEHLILIGPFLITTQQWKTTLEIIGPNLHTFEISDTARWDEECSQTLVEKCPNLEIVGLKRINGLSDQSIQWLAKLPHLRSLEITEPTGMITDEFIIPIIANAGANLEKLVLDGCVELGDDTFSAITQYCPHLSYLSLALLDRITDDCVAKGFKSWNKNHGLSTLNLTRCVGIKDAGVQAALAHSGASLETLSLNSLDELTQETFKLFMDEETRVGNDLVELDVCFVRCVNDDIVNRLSRACKDLRYIKVSNPREMWLMVGIWE